MTPGNDLIQIGGAQPIYDMQGNQRAVTDSTQTVTATQTFDAFGDQIGGTGSTASALQWQGDNLYATYAADAGLILAGSRYYDPQVGRFITRDVYLNQHPYIYCGGNPIGRTDPTGRWFITITWSFCLFSVGVVIDPGGLRPTVGIGPSLPGIGGYWSPLGTASEGWGWEGDAGPISAAGGLEGAGVDSWGVGWGAGLYGTWTGNFNFLYSEPGDNGLGPVAGPDPTPSGIY
jgi:RHS repeat-associated protein